MSGWTIVNYHDISREDSLLTRAIGGTVRPEVFREHLRQMAAGGELIAVEEGMRRLEAGDPFTTHAFSLWFDDAFTGVRRHALPICREFDVTAAVSVNSRFALRREMFWRCQMSYLVMTDGLRFLRAGLRRLHSDVPARLRQWSLEHFSPEMRELIEETYRRFTPESFRADAFRLFDTVEGLQQLVDDGWLITNHTAAHYPLVPELGWGFVEDGFRECETLVRRLNPDNRYWVIPFNFGASHYLQRLREHAVVVHVGNRVNTPATFADGDLYRHSAPPTQGLPFVKRARASRG